MHIDIDASLLAVPNFSINADEAAVLFERVSQIAALALPGHPASVRVWPNVEEILWGHNLGPDLPQIAEFINLVELADVYSANDLVRLYQIVLASCDRLDPALTSLEGVSDLCISPSFPEFLTPVNLIESVCLNLINCVEQQYASDIFSMVASPLAYRGAKDFSVSYLISRNGALHAARGKATALSEIGDLIERDLGFRVWSQARNDNGFALALAVGAESRHGQELRASAETFLDFAFSEGFFETLAAQGATGSGQRSRAVFGILCDLVASRCGKTKHPYGKTQQLIREADRAQAWRLHVTKRHEALRLMYWVTERGLEFSNLDVKGDIRILGENSPAARTFSIAEIISP